MCSKIKPNKQAKALDIPCLKGEARSQRTFVIRLILPVTDHLELIKSLNSEIVSQAAKWGR